MRRTLPGASVKVLEARERIGGRIHTAHVPKDPRVHRGGKQAQDLSTSPTTRARVPSRQKVEMCPVDLGAAYVHGCNEVNSVWRLAACTGQRLDTTNGGYSVGWGETAVWRSRDGRVIGADSVKRAFEVSRHKTHLPFLICLN